MNELRELVFEAEDDLRLALVGETEVVEEGAEANELDGGVHGSVSHADTLQRDHHFRVGLVHLADLVGDRWNVPNDQAHSILDHRSQRSKTMRSSKENEGHMFNLLPTVAFSSDVEVVLEFITKIEKKEERSYDEIFTSS